MVLGSHRRETYPHSWQTHSMQFGKHKAEVPTLLRISDLTDARLRTAISKACKASGIPHFSPHGLRRRRGSLHYKRTGSLAEVATLLGDSKRVAAEHYVYALTDYREVDRWIALARAQVR